jgi:hypothetical protein
LRKKLDYSCTLGTRRIRYDGTAKTLLTLVRKVVGQRHPKSSWPLQSSLFFYITLETNLPRRYPWRHKLRGQQETEQCTHLRTFLLQVMRSKLLCSHLAKNPILEMNPTCLHRGLLHQYVTVEYSGELVMPGCVLVLRRIIRDSYFTTCVCPLPRALADSATSNR